MLANTLQQDLIGAMKAAEALRVSVLRMLLSEMNYKKIDLGRELGDEDIIGVIQKEVKKRREAIDSFTAGGRTDQANQERQEMEILTKYLPAQMDEEQIKAEVARQLENVAEGDRRDFGKVMRVVSPALRGKADGSLVAKVVKDMLNS